MKSANEIISYLKKDTWQNCVNIIGYPDNKCGYVIALNNVDGFVGLFTLHINRPDKPSFHGISESKLREKLDQIFQTKRYQFRTDIS